MKLFGKISALAGLALAALSSSMSVQTASAGSNANCIAYGQTSVRQQASNIRNRCGFSGPRWHYNEAAHYGWCRLVSGNKRRAEINFRARALRRCVGRANAPQNNGGGNPGAINNACIAYANGAVNQQRKNLARQCGYRGSRWQLNFRRHKNWCMNVSRRARIAEVNARSRALRRCGVGGNANQGNGGQPAVSRKDRFCNRYAYTAVTQNRRNINMVCRYRGSRWQDSFARHKNWCMRVSRRSANLETLARKRALRSCSP